MAEFIFILSGTTGEYDSRHTWTVAAYLDQAEAERHLHLLREALGPAWAKSDDYDEREEISERIRTLGLDQHAFIQYTGTEYTLRTVPLRALAPDRAQPRRRQSPLSG